eukprot:jgi/Botrbrau1/14925/Bobra.0018s0029.1
MTWCPTCALSPTRKSKPFRQPFIWSVPSSYTTGGFSANLPPTESFWTTSAILLARLAAALIAKPDPPAGQSSLESCTEFSQRAAQGITALQSSCLQGSASALQSEVFECMKLCS